MTFPSLIRILFVEDDLDIQAIARLALEAVGGFTVNICSNGIEALESVVAFAPDLILLDVMMPGMDGFEMCRQLRASESTAHTPIVMVTALHETADRVQAIDAGADDFLTKPVDAVEVVARVKSLVRAKRDRYALVTTLAELRRVESLRDLLTQMVVHDLRTPLTSMLASTEMLRTYYGDSLSEIQTELVDMNASGCARLLELINDLLDVRNWKAAISSSKTHLCM